MQQGRYAGGVIQRRVAGQLPPGPFRYFDKGTMAVVGAGYAVLQSGKAHLTGVPAWLAWATIHVLFLAQPIMRLSVLFQWTWAFFTRQPSSRLIVDRYESRAQARVPDVPHPHAAAGVR